MLVISVLYALIACSIRRSALDRACCGGDDGSAGDDDGGGGGGRWRRRQRGNNRRWEIRRIAQQTRARLAVLKMLGTSTVHSLISRDSVVQLLRPYTGRVKTESPP